MSELLSTLPIPPKLLFSRRELAALTGLSLGFIDNLIADGTIRVVRLGDRVLIPRHELLRFASVPEGDQR